MKMINSYPKIWALGHSYLKDLLLDDVEVSEKCDGSQFSFGVFDGELCARSKGKQLVIDAPEALFNKAVEVAKMLAPNLLVGWTYRAEYLSKPKHNTLRYNRIPFNHLVIFDISPSLEAYLSPEEKKAEASRIGLECVPSFYSGRDRPRVVRLYSPVPIRYLR